MAAVGVNHELAWSAHARDHSLRIFERAQLITFARQNQIGTLDFFSVAFPGERLRELVKFVLVSVISHPHEALFKSRRCLFEDGMTPRFETSKHHGSCGNARLVSCDYRAEERAKTYTRQPDFLRVDFRPADEPVDQRRSGVDPVLHRNIDA